MPGINLNLNIFVMSTKINPEIKDLMKAEHYRPLVSVIVPFEPKTGVRVEMSQHLKFVVDKVEREIKDNYPGEPGTLVIQKLRGIIADLDFNTDKKSIAIFVSPLFQKILYLDIEVSEKIIIDESFEIRDLVYAKRERHNYLVFLLSGSEYKAYTWKNDSFVKVKTSGPHHIAAVVGNTSERVSNFSDPSGLKEATLRKFLYEADKELSDILKMYPLPVFLLGTEKVLGYFKAISANQKAIAGYIHGNYEDATKYELKELLNPYIQDWKKIKTRSLLQKIESAAGAGKLSTGMEDVWRQALQRTGRLLIVEKNFVYTAERGKAEDIIYKANDPDNKAFYIKDAVDDVIEKVLEYGGDVEFVDEGTLSEYQHIALIQYY